MSPDSTIITNAANGTIITITRMHPHEDHRRMIAAVLAVLSVACFLGAGYLFLRKPKPNTKRR